MLKRAGRCSWTLRVGSSGTHLRPGRPTGSHTSSFFAGVPASTGSTPTPTGATSTHSSGSSNSASGGGGADEWPHVRDSRRSGATRRDNGPGPGAEVQPDHRQVRGAPLGIGPGDVRGRGRFPAPGDGAGRTPDAGSGRALEGAGG